MITATPAVISCPVQSSCYAVIFRQTNVKWSNVRVLTHTVTHTHTHSRTVTTPGMQRMYAGAYDTLEVLTFLQATTINFTQENQSSIVKNKNCHSININLHRLWGIAWKKLYWYFHISLQINLCLFGKYMFINCYNSPEWSAFDSMLRLIDRFESRTTEWLLTHIYVYARAHKVFLLTFDIPPRFMSTDSYRFKEISISLGHIIPIQGLFVVIFA